MVTVYEKVKKVVEEQVGMDGEEISATTSFAEDLNLDSLDLMELMMAIEEKFSDPSSKLEVPDEVVEKMQTIQDVVDYVEETLKVREK